MILVDYTLLSFFFFFNDTATTEIYTLSLHDALPILPERADLRAWRGDVALLKREHALLRRTIARFDAARLGRRGWRSQWSNVRHIYGIASHDLYHAGQIQLLKRLGAR